MAQQEQQLEEEAEEGEEVVVVDEEGTWARMKTIPFEVATGIASRLRSSDQSPSRCPCLC